MTLATLEAFEMYISILSQSEAYPFVVVEDITATRLEVGRHLGHRRQCCSPRSIETFRLLLSSCENSVPTIQRPRQQLEAIIEPMIHAKTSRTGMTMPSPLAR